MGYQTIAEPAERRAVIGPRPWRRGLLRIAPPLLLLVYFMFGLRQAVTASITFDEGPHLAVGYATLRTGDFRLQPVHIHPPLANLVAALPLLLQDDLPYPPEIPGWEINSLSAVADAVVWQYPAPQRIAVAGRVPILLVGSLLGALIYRWARDLRQGSVGVVALALFAFDPNLLAHGALITTDIAATTLIVATLYTLYRTVDARILERQRVVHLLLLGLLLGLAQLTKVSALMLIPVVAAILLLNAARAAQGGVQGLSVHKGTTSRSGKILRFSVVRVRSSEALTRLRQNLRIFSPARELVLLRTLRIFPERELVLLRTLRSMASGAGRFALVMVICALTVWAGYGFSVTRPPGWPLALPAGTHVSIYQSLQEHYTLGHPTFALGRVSSTGWWWYFPLTFVLKTPLPVLILCGLLLLLTLGRAPVRIPLTRTRLAALGAAGRSRIRSVTGSALCIALFPLGYAAAAFFSTVNIGYRHLLPVLPFLYIGLASGIARLASSSPGAARARRWGLGFLGIWLVTGTVRTMPYPLTYFNEIAGAAAGRFRYLVDSNLDWGQNLWDLKAWLDQHNRGSVSYAHYSPARLESYGIEAAYLPPDPRAGAFTPWNPEPGLYAIGATVLQGPYAPTLNTYAWFRAQKPVAQLGHALFVYDVLPQEAPQWAMLCLKDLNPAALPALLGSGTLRVLQPDCEQAYVYPMTESPGLVLLPPHLAPPPGGTLWLSLRDANGDVTANVFRIVPTQVAPQVAAASGVDGPMTLLGHTLGELPLRAGQPLEVTTYWQVNALVSRPLSLMAHLVSQQGAAVAVGDGLGFPIEQWREGDRIVQRHRFMLPADLAPGTQLTVLTGAYWLDTLERWPTPDGSGTIVLHTFTVEN